MGRMALEGMLEVADRRTALLWHLTSNHYPPHSARMVTPALAAIDAMNDGAADLPIPLPEGITHRRYGDMVPAAELVDALHLDAFLQEREGD